MDDSSNDRYTCSDLKKKKKKVLTMAIKVLKSS